MNTDSSRKKKILLIVLLLLINVSLYIGTLQYDFLKDDYRLIVENPRIKTFPAFIQSLGGKFFAFPDFPYLHYWRPLSLFSFFIDYQLWGLHPGGYHLFNILLNGFNALLVFLLFLVVTRKLNYAFITALFFSLHPTHVEAAAWISGRTDLLSAFFLLAAILCFTLFLKKKKTRYYILTALAFLLALLSKENGILFPLLAGILVLITPAEEDTPKQTGNLKQILAGSWRKLLFTLPFWVMDIIYITFHNKFSAVGGVLSGFSISDSFVILKTIGAYARIILLPFFPTPHFSMSYFDSHSLEFLVYFLLALLVLYVIYLKREHYPYTLYSLLFFIFLLPVLDPEIVPSYPKIVIRFAYIPALFAGIFFLESFKLLKSKQARRFFAGLLIFIAAIWAFESYSFQYYYKDQHAHYNGLLQYYQDDGSVLLPAALMKAGDGQVREALALVSHALEINDLDPWLDVSEMGTLLKANLLIISGQEEQGRVLAEKIMGETKKEDMTYFGFLILSKYHEKRGDLNRALQFLKNAQTVGETPDLFFRIALVYAKMGAHKNALLYLDTAIKQSPEAKKYLALKQFIEQQMKTINQQKRGAE